MYCYHCGSQVKEQSKFCARCGTKLYLLEDSHVSHQEEASGREEVSVAVEDFTQQIKGTFYHTTEKISAMVGEKGKLDINLRAVFSSVLKKHTKDEAETLFISGTSLTTPQENEISTSWPKPWLFSRVFFIFALTYVLLYICSYAFQNVYAVPGIIVIGSFAAPFSLLIFFWEMNAPRNISIYEIAKMFFVGGASALVITLLLFSIVPVDELDFTGAIIVGFVEEIGKLVIIAYFIKHLNVKFILNGLLIGAAIGSGFAAFESAGYAFDLGNIYGDDAMLATIFNRAWLSMGTHVVWSAIAGAALVFVKGEQPLMGNHFTDRKFLKLFIIPIILHSIWDMPLYSLQIFNFLFIILIITAWIFIFVLINAGLKQISRWLE
ncbi:PrsW family glutamic-type intramembrane protease [Caldibacillus lycopersici]|uniref:PrsW family glutamic-type intramembrane protease n=1 Tax=Perspicuibacillus lycopersici TaxID=1325689 RepID=A0AAE3IVU8_9BACI|nr:PrsW family glutamic-type intramembrane protease [Perspicuibacillus lycopersici]MCU9613020.1 PrsW family glutamic-type intramembrane protease [Perspicuibacillus lycopersici]